MGHREVTILELVADDDSLRIVSSRLVDGELPGFAKKALKPTSTMKQSDEWHREGDGWSCHDDAANLRVSEGCCVQGRG
jgi:hypothetical protein